MTRSTCGPYANPTVGGLTAAFGHRPGRCRRLQDTYTPADHCCLNGRACRHALPSAAPPSTEERNDVSADVILAKELKGLIRWAACLREYTHRVVLGVLPCEVDYACGQRFVAPAKQLQANVYCLHSRKYPLFHPRARSMAGAVRPNGLAKFYWNLANTTCSTQILQVRRAKPEPLIPHACP